LIKIFQGALGARLHASDLVAALAAVTIAAIVAYSSYRPFFIVGGGIALFWIGFAWLFHHNPLVAWAIVGFLRRTARKVNPGLVNLMRSVAIMLAAALMHSSAL
jgi:hypothetical protein